MEYTIDYNRDMNDSRNFADDVVRIARQCKNLSYREMYDKFREQYDKFRID